MAKKDYNSLTKEQLIDIIERLERSKKYGLVWEEEGAPEKVIVDCQNNFPVLTEVKDKEIIKEEGKPTHVIIEGDNYHALSVLNFTHQASVDLIYIDPPYNTGKENEFMYNDKYVDVNDGYRHSKWLSFISKRLALAKNVLTVNGVIFISIDDNEVAQLKLLCNQIFGEENFVAQFIRKNKAGSGHDSGQVAVEFDYMLCYARNRSELTFKKEVLDVEHDKKYRLKDKHLSHRGKYYLRDLDYKGSYSLSLDYAITTPEGNEIYAGGKFGKHNTWRWSKEKVEWGIENDFIVFKKVKGHWKVYIKQYQFVDNKNKLRERQLPYRALIQFLNSEGSQELNNIVQQNVFKFPKSVGLIEFCLNLIPSKDITVLDFFAGSGTTGHAVLNLNNKDNGNRKFIICTNNENNICEEVTYPRIFKVINGYKNLKGIEVAGINSNLKYYRTTFAAKNKNKDQLKINLAKQSTELICLKEGVYEIYKEHNNYKIFKENSKCVSILYNLEAQWIDQLKNELNNLEGEKVIYCFTPDDHVPDAVFTDWSDTRVEPLPAKILEVYKRLFNK